MKKFFREFKAFISRGNILDLAVGVIIGGAFSAIVTAFTNKIIMPIINLALAAIAGEGGLESAYTYLKKVWEMDADGNYITDEAGKRIVDLTKSIYIDWGAFITAIIDFLLIALVLFLIIKIVMKSSALMKDVQNRANSGRLTHEQKVELKEKGIDRKDKEAVKAYFDEKKAEEERVKAEEEAKAKAEEEEKMKNSTEYLLKEIRDLLKNKE